MNDDGNFGITGDNVGGGIPLSRSALRKTAATNLSLIALTTAVTMILSLALRMAMSRVLGPERIGSFYFAESMANMFFAFLPLGIGTFISRTIPPDPSATSRYFSSICVIQAIAAFVIFAALLGTLIWRGASADVIRVCLVMGLYVALFRFQDTVLKNIFYAIGDTKLVSMVNIWVKVVLVTAGLAALFLRQGVIILAGCFVLSEGIGFGYLLYRTHRQHFFRANVSFAPVLQIIRIGLPFYLAAVLTSIYGNLGPSMLTTYGNNEETGYFGSALRVTGIWLVFVPILYNALVPLLSKALNQNRATFESFAREILELFAVLLLPVSFALSVYGDYITNIIFGSAFIPTQKILSHLTLYLILTYINTICSILIILLYRGHFLLVISGLALLINVAGNFQAIPWGLGLWGKGGGGLGVALSLTFSEGFVCCCMLQKLRKTVLTPRVVWVLLLTCVPAVLWAIWYDELKPFGFLSRTALFVVGSLFFLLLTGSFTPRRLSKLWDLMRKWLHSHIKIG